jgi:hypothetical protein
MAIEQFVSKYDSTEIEAMFDKVKSDMQVIQYTQNEINTLLGKISSMTQPTKVSQLQNDSGFIQNTVNNLVNYYTKTDTYTKTEINALISGQASGGFIVVQELPTTNISTSGIYLVPSTTSKTKNIYDEYININGTTEGWEMIGDTKINLSNYVTTDSLNTTLSGYVTSNTLNTALQSYITSTDFQTVLESYYTKTQVDNTLSNYYTKDQVDELFNIPSYDYNFRQILKAPLHDASDNIADNDLVSNYDITVQNITVSGNQRTISVIFSGTNLKQHTNGANTTGYWMGIAVPESILLNGYTAQFARGFGTSFNINELTFDNLQSEYFEEDTNVAPTGKYCTFYREVEQAKQNNNHAFVIFKLIKSGMNPIYYIYDYDYSNVTLDQE